MNQELWIALTGTIFSLLVLVAAWNADRVFKKLDEIFKELAAIRMEFSADLLKLDRRVTRVEDRLDVHINHKDGVQHGPHSV